MYKRPYKTCRHDTCRVVSVVVRSVDDCDLIVGDNLAHLVHWKGQPDMGMNDGERVTLHFKLRNAELFSVEWV